MAFVCEDCGLVRTQYKAWCVRCRGRNIVSTSAPFAPKHIKDGPLAQKGPIEQKESRVDKLEEEIKIMKEKMRK